MLLVTLRGLRLHQLYECLVEKPSIETAMAVIEESCRMATEEELREELYEMLLAAVSSDHFQQGEQRRNIIFLYESLCVLLKAVYALNKAAERLNK